MVDWRWTGYNTLILLAGMQAIPRDLYESAAIDGAGQWRQFWSITLPMLRPTFLFVTVVSTIGGLQLFTEPLIFNDGPASSAATSAQFQTMAMYMYENSIENTEHGRLRRGGRLDAVPHDHPGLARQLPAGPPDGQVRTR